MIDGLRRGVLGILLCCEALATEPKLNFVFYGDSLTQGLPHVNVEPDTYPFKVGQQFSGSSYTKLGYHGQPTDYLLVHLDSFLFGLIDTRAAANILVLWAGTNDCALGPIDCAQPAYTRLVYMARAHAAGWRVIVVTMIAQRLVCGRRTPATVPRQSHVTLTIHRPSLPGGLEARRRLRTTPA